MPSDKKATKTDRAGRSKRGQSEQDQSERVGRRRFIAGSTALGISAVTGLRPAFADLFGNPENQHRQEAESVVLGQMCTLTPTNVEGPFYLDTELLRSDITEGRDGLPMSFFVRVVEAKNCTPMRDAVVDVWHTDAFGVYSGFESQGTEGETWMRGFQVTNDNGRVRFETVYPRWYPGRTTHFHLKVLLGQLELVNTQIYLPQNISDFVYANIPPYAGQGPADTTNAQDNFYTPETEATVLRNPDGSNSTWAGLTIAVDI